MKLATRILCLHYFLTFLFLSSSFAQQHAPPPAKSLAERLGYPANSRLLIIHADDFGMMQETVQDIAGSSGVPQAPSPILQRLFDVVIMAPFSCR